MALKELWRCPKCGERFVSENLWHACGQFSLEALFARSEPVVLELFRRFEALVRACGPVTVIPQRSRIAFQVRVRFAGAIPRKSYLQCSFGFRRPRPSPRFYKIENYSPHWFGHHCRIERAEQFDEEFRSWIAEAYAVGQQRHLLDDRETK